MREYQIAKGDTLEGLSAFFKIPICMILNLTIVVYDLIQNNNLTFVLFLDIGLLLLGTFIYAYLETELEKKKQVEIQNLILTKQIQAEEKQAELVRNHLQEGS